MWRALGFNAINNNQPCLKLPANRTHRDNPESAQMTQTGNWTPRRPPCLRRAKFFVQACSPKKPAMKRTTTMTPMM
jgi:hypothetical protein